MAKEDVEELLRLHSILLEQIKVDDNDFADSIRDQMDFYWYSLNKEELEEYENKLKDNREKELASNIKKFIIENPDFTIEIDKLIIGTIKKGRKKYCFDGSYLIDDDKYKYYVDSSGIVGNERVNRQKSGGHYNDIDNAVRYFMELKRFFKLGE